MLCEKPKLPPKLDSSFAFDTHNRLSKHPSQLASPSITPKQAAQRTPVQNVTAPSLETPPVPALPSYLKQPKSAAPPSSRSSDSDRATTPSRAHTPQSFKSTDRIPTPKPFDPDPPLVFPLTSPSSPYAPLPHSAASVESADVFATFGRMLSPGANGQAVFSIPSRSGTRTPVSSREPSKSMGPPSSYVSPMSSPAPPITASLPRTPVKMASSPSLNAGVSSGGGGGGSTLRAAPRALRAGASPAPPTPARSTNRPPGHRPPPVAVPPHDGMF